MMLSDQERIDGALDVGCANDHLDDPRLDEASDLLLDVNARLQDLVRPRWDLQTDEILPPPTPGHSQLT